MYKKYLHLQNILKYGQFGSLFLVSKLLSNSYIEFYELNDVVWVQCTKDCAISEYYFLLFMKMLGEKLKHVHTIFNLTDF